MDWWNCEGGLRARLQNTGALSSREKSHIGMNSSEYLVISSLRLTGLEGGMSISRDDLTPVPNTM